MIAYLATDFTGKDTYEFDMVGAMIAYRMLPGARARDDGAAVHCASTPVPSYDSDTATPGWAGPVV